MKIQLKNRILKQKYAEEALRRKQADELLRFAAQNPADAVYAKLNTTAGGLTEEQAEDSRDEYGENIVTHGKKVPVLKRIVDAFINPFTIILLVLASVSAFTDIILAAPSDRNPATVIIIAVMVLLSGVQRFVQETRSGNAAAKLNEMIKNTACVERSGVGRQEIPMEDIVVGDKVCLSAGDMIPADVRITFAKDLFVSQSALTGESEPVEKMAQSTAQEKATESPCLALMGSTVVSGTADAVVLAVGDDTILGDMARFLNAKPPKTSFEKGVNSVSWVLIRFMLVMVPIVFFINGLTKGNWMDAALFAITIAVGLTPEMLPMIVTTCLAKGAVTMSKERVIIKNMNSIQNLGSMDVLCTDKTGTLTQNKVVLESHLDVNGNPDDRVLRHAFLNSFYQTGLRNLLDVAIIDATRELAKSVPEVLDLEKRYKKVDEIPFDFERRLMSIVVSDQNGKMQMITKGAIEEIMKISSFVEYDGKVTALTDEMKNIVLEKVGQLNEQGMRVLGVAQKTDPSPVGAFSTADEADMVLIGYLAFLDPPKETTASALRALKDYGVTVKILTGDNEKVTAAICRKVGLCADHPLLGSELEDLSDEELLRRCEDTTVFAKLSPSDKARVVDALRRNGHSVGYMGDGINDAAAMRKSDVGISVDTSVDIAKEAADVILLEKDLTVLEKGIIEGRKTYANMIKYIKMTASSNFGNIFSVLAAGAFLPFLPMASIHLLLLNLIYDFSCTAIPWDHVDRDFLKKPRPWAANTIGKFMVHMGPISSIFDIATYLLMYFVICPSVCGGSFHTLSAAMQVTFIAVFQAGWFVESMWSQTLVIHTIRTPKLPFIQSRASLPLTLQTLAGITVLTAIPFTPFGKVIGLAPLPLIYFLWLLLIVFCYLLLTTFVKKVYIKKYHEWL